MVIRPLQPSDRAWSDALLGEHFGSSSVVTRGRLHDAAALPGFVALDGGVPVGLVEYRAEDGECEIMALVAERSRQGIGTELLGRVRETARDVGWSRLWLVTTNDNVVAQAFYRALGWRLVAVRKGAIAQSRRLKPEIPERGAGGVRIQDELEYELDARDW